ncbi:MAG: ATP-binding protein, partial [Bacteroidota bacterium]
EERLTLWEKAIPKAAQLANDVNLSAIAQQYELTGANIMNVMQHTCLQSLARGENVLYKADIVDGIKKEYTKEGKLI